VTQKSGEIAIFQGSLQVEELTVLYPVNLDITGRQCLVVGGGTVAARKILSLLSCGGLVRVVSPEICRDITALVDQGLVEWFSREYYDSDILDAFLVFAATNDSAVQQQVAEHAALWGILLNSADNPDQSDFQVPAKIRHRELLITISTGGSSPALATLIKRRLDKEFGPEFGILVDLMAKIRQQVVGGEKTSEQNRALFHDILEQPILDCIENRHWKRLQKLLSDVLPPGIDGAALVREFESEMDGQPTSRQVRMDGATGAVT